MKTCLNIANIVAKFLNKDCNKMLKGCEKNFVKYLK